MRDAAGDSGDDYEPDAMRRGRGQSLATESRPITRSERGLDRASELSVESSTRYMLATPSHSLPQSSEKRVEIKYQNDLVARRNASPSQQRWQESGAVDDVEPDDSVSVVARRGRTHSRVSSCVSQTELLMLEDKMARLSNTV